LVKPGQLNQRLASDLFAIQQICNDKLQKSDGNHKRYMHPSDLREKVLKHLEDNGVLLHLEGKEEIKNYTRQKRHHSRKSLKSSIGTENDRGGKRSLYVTTDEFENLKKILDKPDAQDFLHFKIIRSGLALKLAKYLASCTLYTAKMNKQAFQKVLGVGASLSQLGLTTDKFSTLSTIHRRMQTMDDDQLEEAADKLARKVIEEKGAFFVSAGTLPLRLIQSI
jgi:hypothetical protein